MQRDTWREPRLESSGAAAILRYDIPMGDREHDVL
jgi:hypothetical protein